MPSYANVQDMINLASKKIIVQLTDDVQNGQISTDVVEDAIDRAEGILNAAMGAAGYAVPVALPIPDGAGVIKSATVWLALCDLAARRGIVPEDYKTQCDLYQKIVDQIRQGLLALPIPSGAINMPHSSTLGQQRRMSVRKWENEYTALRNPDEDHTLEPS